MLDALAESVNALAVSVFDEHGHVAVEVALAVLVENLDGCFNDFASGGGLNVAVQGGSGFVADVVVDVAVSFGGVAVLAGGGLNGETGSSEAVGQFGGGGDRFHVLIFSLI